MTGIIAMVTILVRTETCEMRRTGENLRIDSGRRIAVVRRRPSGLAGARCQPQIGIHEPANIQMVNKPANHA
jgi:hypothetical protein